MKSCILLLFAGYAAAGFAVAVDVNIVEEIVTKVNGDIITRTELERGRKAAENEFRAQGLNGNRLRDAIDRASKDLLRDRIDNLLLVQRAKELNTNVDSDVTKQLAEIQRQSKIPDPEKFQAFVREQTGMPYEDYKSEIKNNLLKGRVVRQGISSKMQFRREELMDYYNSHKDQFQRKEQIFLRQILISTDGKDAAGIAAAEKKAKDLVTRARGGEKFPELALSNSDNKATAEQGGDIGGFEKGQLRPALETAIWDQPRGYVTDPIRTSAGFEVYRVDEHFKEGLTAFEDVENEVADRIFQPRMEPTMRAYMTKLRQDAYLEIKAGYEDSGAAPGKNTAWTDPAQLKPETITKEEVQSKGRKKRLLWTIPVPGTNSSSQGTSSSR